MHYDVYLLVKITDVKRITQSREGGLKFLGEGITGGGGGLKNVVVRNSICMSNAEVEICRS